MAPPLGYPKQKSFNFRGLRSHWPPDQGLCPKMCQQYYRTVLLPGLVLVYIYCLIVPHRNCMRKKLQMTPFQLAKMKKNRRFQGWFFENFSGDIAPRPPYWGGATAMASSPTAPLFRMGYGGYAPRKIFKKSNLKSLFFFIFASWNGLICTFFLMQFRWGTIKQ